MRHASLFSGIGGFDLAAQNMGWENIFHCEKNPFCQTVLKYYWPDATTYGDIYSTDFTIHAGTIDILTGGFPCQPFSTAGKRKGTDDDRHLWPQMLRAIREIKPAWIVGENVPGILTIENGMVFESVCTDLENEGYEIWPVIIPACATDAPHRRDRIWIVAYCSGFDSALSIQQRRQNKTEDNDTDRETWINSKSCNVRCDNWSDYREERHIQEHERVTEKNKSERERCIGGISQANPVASNNNNKGLEGGKSERNSRTKGCNPKYFNEREHWLEAATRLCIVDDGLSGRLDGITVSKWRKESLMAAGNAIVPQVAFEIFKAIEHSQTKLQLT